MITHGVFIPLLQTPPAFFVDSPPLVGEKLTSWHKLRDHYLFTGAIRALQSAPAHCCSSFLVPKKDGGFRLVIDLRPINMYFPVMSTKYESLHWLHTVPRSVCAGASLDL